MTSRAARPALRAIGQPSKPWTDHARNVTRGGRACASWRRFRVAKLAVLAGLRGVSAAGDRACTDGLPFVRLGRGGVRGTHSVYLRCILGASPGAAPDLLSSTASVASHPSGGIRCVSDLVLAVDFFGVLRSTSACGLHRLYCRLHLVSVLASRPASRRPVTVASCSAALRALALRAPPDLRL